MMDIDDLPVVLYAPHRPEGWVRTVNATWADLEASMEQHLRITADIVDETARFTEAVERLEPLMSAHPSLTVAEAAAELERRRRVVWGSDE